MRYTLGLHPGRLRYIKRVRYPRTILPEGWREVVPTNQPLLGGTG
ncbi:hypothetical protein [Rhodopila globiformis]|nr:hypothetical protein [Rhodopila globiformis]